MTRLDPSFAVDQRTDLRPETTRRSGLADTVGVAVLTGVISLAGASRPSLWFDEAATISASTRSLPELFRLMGNIDAVHGLYYLVMHGWFAIAPATEFWSRVPSGLAVAVTAAGVVVLAKQFSHRSVALCAGVAFAILPRTTWAGIEARSYAFAALIAVWLTVLFVAAARRNRPRLWLLYGLVLLVAVALNIYLILMVLVFAALLPVLSGPRSTAAWWSAMSVGVVVTAPLIILSHGQIAQIGWIAPLSASTVGDFALDQYFDDSIPFAIVAGILLVAGIVLRLRAKRLWDSGTGQLAVICLTWIVIPTAVILVCSALVKPIFYPRYLFFTAPAMAILLGICVVTVAQTRGRSAAILVVLALAAAPHHVLVQRGPYAKEGMDFSQVADLLQEAAAPGDCLLLDNSISWKPGPIRALPAARPAAYRHLIDPGRGKSGSEQGWLWDAHIPVHLVADRIGRCRVLWTVTERDPTLPDRASGTDLPVGPAFADAPAFHIARGLGFRIVERRQFSFAQVIRAEQSSL